MRTHHEAHHADAIPASKKPAIDAVDAIGIDTDRADAWQSIGEVARRVREEVDPASRHVGGEDIASME
jgi:hypothetical protein